jgi:ABC transporter substrate binding protein
VAEKNKCRAASLRADRRARLGSCEVTPDTGILSLLGRRDLSPSCPQSENCHQFLPPESNVQVIDISPHTRPALCQGPDRDLIITLAARHRLPAVYPYRFFITGGGLISYGPDTIDPLRRAAGYVDRILKGEKPADLPVQQANRAELIINKTTAKALGLTIPETLLATADEVIQ